MNITLYTIIIIATSVLISALVNVLIMRKVSEMAASEIARNEKRWFKLIEKITD